MEFENNDIICSFPVKSLKFSLAPSALALNTLLFSLKYLKTTRFATFYDGAQKTKDYVILACVKCLNSVCCLWHAQNKKKMKLLADSHASPEKFTA